MRRERARKERPNAAYYADPYISASWV